MRPLVGPDRRRQPSWCARRCLHSRWMQPWIPGRSTAPSRRTSRVHRPPVAPGRPAPRPWLSARAAARRTPGRAVPRLTADDGELPQAVGVARSPGRQLPRRSPVGPSTGRIPRNPAGRRRSAGCPAGAAQRIWGEGLVGLPGVPCRRNTGFPSGSPYIWVESRLPSAACTTRFKIVPCHSPSPTPRGGQLQHDVGCWQRKRERCAFKPFR